MQDQDEDRLHPYKKERPLAKDLIPFSQARFVQFFLVILGLSMAACLSTWLVWILTAYLLINFVYSQGLKALPVLDVSLIALGFMLRVFAGTIGIGLQVSWWLTLTTCFLSLFIALGKRRMEVQLNVEQPTRKVLQKYAPDMLNNLMTGAGVICFLIYCLYIAYVQVDSFYFILTLPFAAFALWRFSYLTTQGLERDDPILLFLSDPLSQINLVCFSILTAMGLFS